MRFVFLNCLVSFEKCSFQPLYSEKSWRLSERVAMEAHGIGSLVGCRSCKYAVVLRSKRLLQGQCSSLVQHDLLVSQAISKFYSLLNLSSDYFFLENPSSYILANIIVLFSIFFSFFFSFLLSLGKYEVCSRRVTSEADIYNEISYVPVL